MDWARLGLGRIDCFYDGVFGEIFENAFVLGSKRLYVVIGFADYTCARMYSA